MQCFKENLKEFFIDFVFDEIVLANLNDDNDLKDSLRLKKIKQNKKFYNSLAVTIIFIAKIITKIY